MSETYQRGTKLLFAPYYCRIEVPLTEVGMDQVLSNSSDDMGVELLGALLRAMFDKEEEIFQVSDLFLTLSVESNEKTSV